MNRSRDLGTANAAADLVSSVYVGALIAAGRAAIAFATAAAVGALGATWVFAVSRPRSSVS